ncbi:hypothetical protein RIdsm_04724 [Roseovarius indicus]|nr:hypothetical protein [Roseovarius indicus]QEW28884.1 hypothetical protein RIdsm_04724 [Roseovarius indicus]SFD83081.1 hypothetical protein SAMN04488031_102778 [Roseovarius indicus]
MPVREVTPQGFIVHKVASFDFSRSKPVLFAILVDAAGDRSLQADIEDGFIIEPERYGDLLAWTYGEQLDDDVWRAVIDRHLRHETRD